MLIEVKVTFFEGECSRGDPLGGGICVRKDASGREDERPLGRASTFDADWKPSPEDNKPTPLPIPEEGERRTGYKAPNPLRIQHGPGEAAIGSTAEISRKDDRFEIFKLERVCLFVFPYPDAVLGDFESNLAALASAHQIHVLHRDLRKIVRKVLACQGLRSEWVLRPNSCR